MSVSLTQNGAGVKSNKSALYTTPVIYLYLDRFSLWFKRLRQGRRGRVPASAVQV
jgi:hypothetical protein